MRAHVSLALSLALLAGCYEAEDVFGPEPVAAKVDGREDGKAVWTQQDSPTLFSDDLEYRLTELPTTGEVSVAPWAGSYWPVYEDSVNKKWAGDNTQSPAAKYGEAFGVEDIEDKVSASNGIDKYASRTVCTDDSACDADIAEACAIREGATEGVCIPTWWGICHAWAPASITVPEPVNPVTRNGVTFEVNDIKALATLAFDATNSRFVSLRCNEDASAGDIEYDGYNRPSGSDTECADTNPGTYHVLLTNYLGLRDLSFVEDRTWDDEVWNQPLRAYRILHLDEIDAQSANELLDVQAVGGEPAAPSHESFSGTVAKDAWHHHTPVAVEPGSAVRVAMTGDNHADLYLRWNQAPTTSDWICRPYANGSAEECEIVAPNTATELHVSVQGYATSSNFSVDVTVTPQASGGTIPTEYQFNDDAASLRYVELEVDYIGESASHVDGNLSAQIDTYTHTDTYEYILELDADGKIIGGEWMGASKSFHPDFLWLPTGRDETKPIAGGAVTWAHVNELLTASTEDPTVTPSATQVATEQEQGTLSQGQWAHFGPFTAVEGQIGVEMTGTGDADLYVRMGALPSVSEYDCRPYRNGSTESCTAEGPGELYVSVRGYTASTFDLTITYTREITGGDSPVGGGDDGDPLGGSGGDDGDPLGGNGGDDGDPLGGGDGNGDDGTDGNGTDGDSTNGGGTGLDHLNEAGQVAQGEWHRFTIEVIAGQPLTVQTAAPNDVDLYLRLGAEPTSGDYDARGYTTSGNEVIEYTPAASGTLHVAVHGWAASAYTLTSFE